MLRRIPIALISWYRVQTFSSTSVKASKPLGFIGCGQMGRALVQNLLKNGSKVVCYDHKPKAIEKVKKLGADIATSSADVASKSDIIFTLLPDYKKIEEALDGKNGVLETATKDCLVVDISTIGPVNTLRIQMILEESGVNFLSAPVSGAAESKESIIFLVGGKKSLVDKVEPFLKQMTISKNRKIVFHLGENIGDGQSARICNLLLLSCCMVATSETMSLGMKLGIDPKILAESIDSSSARNWVCQEYNPVPGVSPDSPAASDYIGGHSVYGLLKTLGVAQNISNKIRCPIPVSSLAAQIYCFALVRGYANKNCTAVFNLYEQHVLQQV